MSKSAPIISDATEADASAVIAMHAESWLDTYPNEAADVSHEWVEDRVEKWRSPEKVAARIEKIEQAKNNPGMLYRIAKDRKGDVVGLAISFRDKEIQCLGALYVNKAYYGTGLAQRFMDEIIMWADPTRPIEFEVATYNERAKAFYRKYGFEEVKGTERLYDVIPVVKMVRRGADS
jgi:RimJ/RimL family protein N-acetyltransferase